MEKEKILQQALAQLNNYTSDALSVISGEPVFSIAHVTSDAKATLTIAHQQINLRYEVFVQPWTPQKDIDALIAQIKTEASASSAASGVILFADFVNPVMAEKFRRRSISFVDCAGNLFIKDKSLNFFVKGKKTSSVRAKRVRGRAFNTAGLKLIFAIFNRPELLHATYREISNEVGIALGSVGPVMDDLYASGYILDDGQRKLVNKNRLFERWVDGYLEKLRPKQILCCYVAEDPNWWKQANPDDFGGVWGGETVIAKSTPFMVPETFSLYFSTEKKTRDFADAYGLKQDDDGDICLYKAFWSSATDSTKAISSMIMYADIVDSINPGNWNVAKTFYGEAVAHLLSD